MSLSVAFAVNYNLVQNVKDICLGESSVLYSSLNSDYCREFSRIWCMKQITIHYDLNFWHYKPQICMIQFPNPVAVSSDRHHVMCAWYANGITKRMYSWPPPGSDPWNISAYESNETGPCKIQWTSQSVSFQARLWEEHYKNQCSRHLAVTYTKDRIIFRIFNIDYFWRWQWIFQLMVHFRLVGDI